MKIIISPAKKMNENDDSIRWKQQPTFLEQTKILKNYLRNLSYREVKDIWQCNDKIARLNFERFQSMSLDGRLTPAVLSYEGLQYQHMAPQVFEEAQWQYIEEHLVILSGFYGMLRATDAITPYRLEMQAKINLTQEREQIVDLYQYWGDTIYRKLTEDDKVILNLASKEYSKVIEPFLSGEDQFVTCTFGEVTEVKGKRAVKVKGTQAKMARGEMVRYLAEHNIQDLDGVKNFNMLSFTYSEEDSTDGNLVFIK